MLLILWCRYQSVYITYFLCLNHIPTYLCYWTTNNSFYDFCLHSHKHTRSLVKTRAPYITHTQHVGNFAWWFYGFTIASPTQTRHTTILILHVAKTNLQSAYSFFNRADRYFLIFLWFTGMRAYWAAVGTAIFAACFVTVLEACSCLPEHPQQHYCKADFGKYRF